MDKPIYFNFPIPLLSGAFDNIKGVTDNIMNYAVYRHSLKLHGKELKRMDDAASFFDITLGDTERSLQSGKKLHSKHSTQAPMASVSRDVVFNFYSEYKEEFEIACFCVFSAIKSILGNKEYCKTNKDLIISRMFGLSGNNTELKPKYSKRYQIDKVLFELQESWGLKLYSNRQRGFYLSFTKELHELIIIAEEKKIAVKKANLVSKKNEARRLALQHIHSTKTAP